MERVIDTFFEQASAARDFKLILRFQWVLNSCNDFDSIIDGFLKAKALGY